MIGQAFVSRSRSGVGRFFYRLLLWTESTTKWWLFGCSMCGQCVLSYNGYICPRRCAKQLSNGPCGGSQNGVCEVGDRPCVWHQIHSRRAILGEIDALDCYMPPRDWSLTGSSAYVNHFKGLDAHIVPQCDHPLETSFVKRSLHSLRKLGGAVTRFGR